MLLIYGLLLTDAAGAAQPSRAETELVQAEAHRFDAQVANDVAALRRALADELVYTHASGKVQNKAEYLQGIESGAAHYRGIEVADRVARVWGNMGLTHGTITLDIGADKKLTSRYMGVYIKRAGRWQLLAWQSTSV
jgi:hypothetical protein